jgi:hypothetical protein
MSVVDVLSAVDVDTSSRSSIEDPSLAPTSESTQPRRYRQRRRRAEFIRDVRRLIVTSWLAKTGQRWRWTPLDREYIYRLALRVPAWEIMALWDCYLDRPFRECKIPHFCQGSVLDRLRDDERAKPLADMYRDRLYYKRAMKS